MLYGVDNCPGCRENFLAALARFGMGRRDIVPNVNFFMRVPVERGAMRRSRAGTPHPAATWSSRP